MAMTGATCALLEKACHHLSAKPPPWPPRPLALSLPGILACGVDPDTTTAAVLGPAAAPGPAAAVHDVSGDPSGQLGDCNWMTNDDALRCSSPSRQLGDWN